MLGDYSLYSVLIFSVLVVACLLIDLLAHRGNSVISAKNAAMWSIFWISLAFAFSAYVGYTHGKDDFFLFTAGYLLEKSLSVDNLFVMMAIFAAFSINDKYQHRVLYYGIIGALVLRLVFVALGTTILEYGAKYALTAFGLFVLWSAWKMWANTNSENQEIEDYANHWSVKMTKRFMPVHHQLDGHKFFTKVNGKVLATPLLLCLVCIEFADVMFAFDSVPAIIAITEKPFLVYTSNIFAILGLRSLYFLLAAAKRYLCHLEKSVIIILIYIGMKMLLDVAGEQFGIPWLHFSPAISLAVVIGILALGVLASFIFPTKSCLIVDPFAITGLHHVDKNEESGVMDGRNNQRMNEKTKKHEDTTK